MSELELAYQWSKKAYGERKNLSALTSYTADPLAAFGVTLEDTMAAKMTSAPTTTGTVDDVPTVTQTASNSWGFKKKSGGLWSPKNRQASKGTGRIATPTGTKVPIKPAYKSTALGDLVRYSKTIPKTAPVPTTLAAAMNLKMTGSSSQPTAIQANYVPFNFSPIGPTDIIPRITGDKPMAFEFNNPFDNLNFDTNPGILPRGPGGGLQLPFSGADPMAALKQFSLDDQFLKISYRAPKGYVVLRDASGRPFPVLKKAAQYYGLWKPAKKPPISVGDWQAFLKAGKVMKKLKLIEKKGRELAKFGAPARRAPAAKHHQHIAPTTKLLTA